MPTPAKCRHLSRASAIGPILAFSVLIYATSGPQIAPPTVFSSQNDFLEEGTPLNGGALVTSPLKSMMPGPYNAHSAADPDGFIARARVVSPSEDLGDFTIHYTMTEKRQGAGAVLARGPVPMLANAPMPPPHDSISYLYIVGGKSSSGVSGTIERANIDADGQVHPGLESNPAGFLVKARYGAAVVASADSIYVIGGYDGNDQPLNSIERIRIGPTGDLGPSSDLVGPGWGGDVSAVIVNGYLYVIGGNTLQRGPDEGAVRDVTRAAIRPDGSLSAFENLTAADALLPVGVAGGRVFVVAAWETAAPVYHLYYVGGNVGNTVNGATRNVYRLRVNGDNSIEGPWASVPDGSGLVTLNEPRELFAAVVSNGYAWIIGGESTAMGHTTYYSTIERAEIRSDGSIGQFSRLDPPRETYINGLDRASDITGVAFNNGIYVPGGRDGLGSALDVVFQLDLGKPGVLLHATVPDTSIFSATRDLGADREIDSLFFDIEPDAAHPGGILFRFRWAGDSGAWSAWSGYVPVEALPIAIHGSGRPPYLGTRHLLDLGYAPGLQTGCTEEVIANPTVFQGPLTARFLEYEVVMPRGGENQRFDALTFNAHPLVRFALPGGHDPRFTGQVHPPSCTPSHAIADAGAQGWVRFQGTGFPMEDYTGRLALVRVDSNAPVITIDEINQPASGTIDMRVRIESRPGGPWDYELVFDMNLDGQFTSDDPTLLAPALRVHPAVRLVSAPAHGLDIVTPGNATANDNVVRAPDAQAGVATFAVAVAGTDFRSGRMNDTSAVATDDPNATSHWPGNPAASLDDQPFFLRYKMEDLTAPNAVGFVDLKIAGTQPGAWRDVGPGELKNSGRFDIVLEIDYRAKSGPHDLEFTIQNPQLGTTHTVKQSIHVVPALRVEKFVTRQDPTPDLGAGSGNKYDWTGSHNPAVADLGDGIGTPNLNIDVVGAGFMSDSGKPLVLGVSSMTPQYGPGVGAFDPLNGVIDRNNFTFLATVPQNTHPGRHSFSFNWRYDLGTSDPFDSVAQVPPVRDHSVLVEETWRPVGDPWQALYVVPPRVAVQSVLGSSNTRNPIILLQSDPTLTVNGVGFAVGGPTVGFDSVVRSSRLISKANSPNEDILVQPSGVHMVSDCQARLSMQMSSAQRPGEIYQLEIQTRLPVPESSGIRDPYSVGTSAEMVTVLPLPSCDRVDQLGPFFAVEQGATMPQVKVFGGSFDSGTRVDLGPGITISNLVVCTHLDLNSSCPTQDMLSFDVAVDPLAAPGRRTVEVENGPTSAISQRASCSSTNDMWVVPVPDIGTIQPETISAPPASEGTSRVTIDVYGANFISPLTMRILNSGGTTATGVTVSGPVAVVDGGHLAAELVVNHAGTDAVYGLEVSEPAGPAGMPNKLATGTFRVAGFRELGIAGVTSQTSQCQGRTGTMQVTGANFKDPSGTSLVSSVSLGSDVSLDSWVLDSATAMTIHYSVGEGASLGKRPLVLNPVMAGGTPAVWPNALTVTSSPSIISISPQAVSTGSSRLVTISGRNFYEGGAVVTISPAANLTVSPATIVNTGLVQVTITTDNQATPDLRSIIVTNGDGGQCNVATLTSAFQVIPQMSISGVTSQTTQCQGRSGALLVTGANFRDPSGAPLVGSATLGPDVLVDSMTINSATSLSIAYVTSETAAIGKRSLTLNPTVQGASPAVWPNALTLTSSPVIIGVSPRGLSPGDTRQITVTGRNFLPSATLSLTPSAGTSLSNVSVVTNGLIVATLAVDPSATPGVLAISLDNQDGACAVATLNGAVTIADPPHMTSWKFSSGNLVITGWNFHRSLQAYIDGSTTSYARTNVKSNVKVNLGKVKSLFPVGVEKSVRLVNPDDGGEVTFIVKR